MWARTAAKTLGAAMLNPGLKVYAFEPNLGCWHRSSAALPTTV